MMEPVLKKSQATSSYPDFEHILNVPPIYSLNENLFQYFAKVHSFANPSSIFASVYCVITLLQQILACILFPIAIRDNKDAFSSILKVLSPILCGGSLYSNTDALITTTVSCSINLLLLFFILIRVTIYKKTKTMTEMEETIMLTITKYFIPMTLPFVVSGVPYAIVSFFIGKGKVRYIILIICSAIIVVAVLYLEYFCFCPRIMFSKEILHEWDSFVAFRTSLAQILATVALIASQYLDKYFKMGMALVQFVAFFIFSYFSFSRRDYVNPSALSTVCVIASTLQFSCIVNLIDVFIPISIIVYVLICFIIFVIFYFTISAINNKEISKFLNKIEECEEDINTMTSKELALAIKATINMYPYDVFTFSLIEKMLDNSEDNNELLVVYARIVSAFPHYNPAIHSVISRIKESTILTKRILILQLQTIAMRRSTSATPEVISFFQSSIEHTKSIDAATFKFWDNVMADDTTMFWQCVDSRNQFATILEKESKQICSTYENVADVISRVIGIYSRITYNYDDIPPLTESMKLLAHLQPSHTDRAMENFIKVFPGVINISKEFSEDIHIVGGVSGEGTGYLDDYEEKRGIYDMILGSGIGSEKCIDIYLILATIIIMILSFLFYDAFKTNVVDNVFKTTETYLTLDSLLFNVARYAFIKYSSVSLLQPDSPLKNDDATMKMNSPNWFGVIDQIPRFVVTRKEVQDVAHDIRDNLETLSGQLVELDKGNEATQRFVKNFNSLQVKTTNKSISAVILDIALKMKVDDEFINNVLHVYDLLKKITIDFAETTKFDKQIEKTNIFMVSVIICTVLFVSLPVMFHLYKLTIQMNEIAEAFTTIPVNELRDDLGSTDTKFKSNEKYATDLKKTKSADLLIATLVSLIITIVPVIACSVAFFFYGMYYIQYANEKCKSAAYIKLGQSTIRIAFINIMRAFQESYVGTETPGINKDIVKRSMMIAKLGIKASASDVTKSTLMISSFIDNWLAVEENYRSYFPPLNETVENIPACGAGFERLTFQKWLHTIDNLVFFMDVTQPGEELSLMYYNFETYLIWWMYENREVPYFDIITKALISDVFRDDSMLLIITIMLCLFVVMYIVEVIIFNKYKQKITNALLLLLQLKPSTVVKCQPLMTMLAKGRYISEDNNSFYTSNAFIKYVDYGIAKIDKNLNIFEKNPAFESYLPDYDNLIQLEGESDEEKFTFNSAVSAIHEAFKRSNPRASFKLMVKKGDEKLHFNANIIAVSDGRLAYENDNAEVTYCILIIKEKTNAIKAESIVAQKHKELADMLNKVLPPYIVTALHNGSDSISFNVHSITMGEISVRASKRFSFTTNDPHVFYNKIFQKLDTIMENYPILCRMRTFAHNYTFAGGLFMDVNKPEKHAEETIRYLLEVIGSIPEMSKECGTEVNLTLCVHTGGPIVAGVMSIELPSFVVLGNVHRYLHELKVLGERNVIHITRAVYELIFSAGFNISESDSIQIGDETVNTYTIYK